MLNESKNWQGEWWPPDNPDEKFPGTLYYDGQGNLTLSLIGGFDNRIMEEIAPGTFVFQGYHGWDAIYGMTTENQKITLFESHVISSKSNSFTEDKPYKQKIRSTIALIGTHDESQENESFSKIRFSIDDMATWSGTSSIIAHIPESYDKTTISVEPINEQKVEINGEEFRLLHHCSRLANLKSTKRANIGTLEEYFYMEIVPKDSFSLKAGFGKVRSIQSLISLATNQAVGVQEISLENKSETNRDTNSYVQVFYKPITLCKTEESQTREPLFTCKALPFETIICNWVENYSKLKAAINMFIALKHKPAAFVENTLLAVASTAEVLHRNLFSNATPPIPPEEFKEMREQMLNQIQKDEYKTRFKAAIRNDHTLRDRLKGLANNLDVSVIDMLIPDVELWAKCTAKSRNSLTHEGKIPDTYSPETLLAAIEITEAIITLNIAKALGLSTEHQIDAIRRMTYFQKTARNAQKYLRTQ